MNRNLRHTTLWLAFTVAGLLAESAGAFAQPAAKQTAPKTSREQNPERGIVRSYSVPACARTSVCTQAQGPEFSDISALRNCPDLQFLPSSAFLRPEPPGPVRVRLLFAGDLMQHMPQVTAARRGDGFDYNPVFEYVRPRFQTADFAVVNLETTLTTEGNYSGYPCFRSPVALADALRDLGVDVAVLANNHCCDGGLAGVRTTLRELARCNVRRTGVFTDSLDRARHNPLRFVLKGVRFALLNYTYGTNGIPTPREVHVNRIDTVQMAADLALARRDTADCVVVCIHWGDEYQPAENVHQRLLAEFLHRHGTDIIVGSHPHVAQPWTCDGRRVTLYSLGNFVSNQRQRRTDGGLLAEVEVVRYPGGRMEYGLEVVPVWVDMPGYRILPPEAADTMRLPQAYVRFRADIEKLRSIHALVSLPEITAPVDVR